MKIQCIALDLDGTTLFDDNSITQPTKAALEAAIQQGIHLVVASGRCLDALPRCITEIEGLQYAITSNGAAVYQIQEKKCLKRFLMPAHSIEKIIHFAKPYSVAYEAFFQGKAYASGAFIDDPVAYGISPDLVRYIQTTRNRVKSIEQFILENKEAMDNIDLIVPHPEEFSALLQDLKTRIPELYVTSSVSNRIEIAAKEAGKQNALAFLLQHLGVPRETTAAFGNADNDIEMLSYVPFGFAVENATPNCKKAAVRLVPANTEDGVAFGICSLMEMNG